MAGRSLVHHPSGEASRGIARLYGNGFNPSHWDGNGPGLPCEWDGSADQEEKETKWLDGSGRAEYLCLLTM